MAKYEMHLHTSECDICAAVSGSEAVRLYKAAGYDGMVVTNHYFSMFSEWYGIEQTEENHRRYLDRWLLGYREALAEGEKIGFSVFLGAEVRFDGANINDYLVYGLSEDDIYNLPYLNKLSNVKEMISLLPENALVVHAHPFRCGMTVEDPSLLFGIEVHNGGTDAHRNELARLYAEHYGKKQLSGSDFHAARHLARGGIETEKTVRNYEELLSILRAGNYSLIENSD